MTCSLEKFSSCSWYSQMSWEESQGVESHEMEATHADSPLQGDALYTSICLITLWSLQAQVCECGCCLHAHLAASVNKHSLVHVAFAYIYIGLFACVHKRPLCWSMAPFKNISMRAQEYTPAVFCCCQTPVSDLKLPATVTEHSHCITDRLQLSVY